MKNSKLWITLCVAIFTVGIIGCLWVLKTPESHLIEIVQDGTVLYRFTVSEMQETQAIAIKTSDRGNSVLIENGRICISSADCPDQTCVKMGYLQSTALPLVCLPNHLVIQYADNTGENFDGRAE